jgi:hypothetical protein
VSKHPNEKRRASSSTVACPCARVPVTSEMLAASRKRGEILRDIKAKIVDAIQSDFLSFEPVVKDCNGGALPEWVKDNSDWRLLDKEFSR